MNGLFQVILAYAGTFVLAVVFLLVGLFLINKLIDYVANKMEDREIDGSLQSFLKPLIKIGLLIILVISIASMIGVEMTSFIAILAAMSFAVGMAFQGSLANFAGGVLIIILKPFRIGDYIETGSYAGTVKEIQIFYTVLHTPDNRKIIIPNAQVSNNSAVNYSANDIRRIDMKFGVSYNDDIYKVKDILQRIADEHPLVIKEPEPMIVLGEHGDSAIVFYFRVWCNTADYWNIYFDLMEKVKLAFDRANINIPYPQMDVHLDK